MIGLQPTLRDLLKAVSDVSDVPVEQMRGERKFRDFAHARMAYCWLAREFTGRSWTLIARQLIRDHTTAMESARRCQQFLDEQPEANAARWARAVQHNLGLYKAPRALSLRFADEGDAMRQIWG